MENTAGFYKLEDGNWYYGTKIIFPDGEELSLETKDSFEYPFRDWIYYDIAPQEYLDFIFKPRLTDDIYNI